MIFFPGHFINRKSTHKLDYLKKKKKRHHRWQLTYAGAFRVKMTVFTMHSITPLLLYLTNLLLVVCAKQSHCNYNTAIYFFWTFGYFFLSVSCFGKHACNVSSQQGRGHSCTPEPLHLISSADVAVFSLNTQTFVDQSILTAGISRTSCLVQFLLPLSLTPALVCSSENVHLVSQAFCAFLHFKKCFSSQPIQIPIHSMLNKPRSSY